MPIDPTQLATPAAGLHTAVAHRAEALRAVQASVGPTDRVTLSSEARDAAEGAPPAEPVTSTERAVADAAQARVGVEAAAATIRAEDERMAALMFVIAHHGPPLRGR